jgi:hypothetical protein
VQVDPQKQRQEWCLVEDALLSVEQVQAGRKAGVLLTALRNDPEIEHLLVKFTASAAQALRVAQ